MSRHAIVEARIPAHLLLPGDDVIINGETVQFKEWLGDGRLGDGRSSREAVVATPTERKVVEFDVYDFATIEITLEV